MTRHTSHSVTPVAPLPHLFTPAEVAETLGCSAWWLKEQARRRRIPFTKPGGAYRFTAEHVAEIIALFEVRPETNAWAVPVIAPAPRARPAQAVDAAGGLRARTPRRAQKAKSELLAA